MPKPPVFGASEADLTPNVCDREQDVCFRDAKFRLVSVGNVSIRSLTQTDDCALIVEIRDIGKHVFCVQVARDFKVRSKCV